MKKGIISLGLVGMLLGAMFIGMIGLVPSTEGANGDWIERYIVDIAADVNAVAIGDADNDGSNEVVIGLSQSQDEVRMYKRMDNIWVESIIAHLGVSVNSIVIGDSDNDGFNEVIAGTEETSGELQIFEKIADSWVTQDTRNTPEIINSVAVGDADNDDMNEIVIGLISGADEEIRAYEYNKGSGNYIETMIAELSPVNVNTVAIGDPDNDTKNEIIVGLSGTINEVRIYENVSNVWVESNVTDIFPDADVHSVTIGDADNNGDEDIVIGIESTSFEVRILRYSGGWVPESVADVLSDVNAIAIEDIDTDGNNEIVIGMATETNELRAYEYVSASWVEDFIADVPTDIYSVSVGDANNDGVNDVVIGMNMTTNEVRMFTLDKGQITLISHENGEYVKGTTTFEAQVTSDYIKAVKFYLNDQLMFTDSSFPYQFVLDTTALIDDTTYTIKAEGLRDNAPSLIDTVDVIVKNAAIVGDYISVSTLRFEYTPDQQVAVIVTTMSPPAYDYVDLVIGYTDPSGNEMFAMEGPLPVAAQYIIILPLSSDAELGLYDVSANAYGYDGDFLIWEAANTTSFNVSGKNLQELLDDLNAQQVALNNTITSLSEVVENEHEFTRSEILARINDTIDELQGFDQTVIDHDTEIKAIMDALNDLVENEHNQTKIDIITGLGLVLEDISDLDAHLTQEASDITTQITDSTDEIDTNLATHDDNLDSAKEDAKEASEKLATYQLVTMVLLIIALVFLLISLMLVNKGYKMMKDAKSSGKSPPKEEPPEVEIEEDEEIEGAIDDALGDIESVDSEEP